MIDRTARRNQRTGSARELWLMAAATTAAAAGLLLAGCDRENQANQTAFEEAVLRLERLGAASAPLPTSQRKVGYEAVLSEVRTATADDPAPGRASAAWFLSARANAGLGAIYAAEASEMERRGLSRMLSVRKMVDIWLSDHSLADALDSFDPSEQMMDLDDREAELEGLREEALAAMARTDATISNLETEVEAALARAGQERQQEAALRQRAVGMTATQAEALVIEAAGHRRLGDGHDREASVKRAEANLMEPVAVEVGREIAKLTNQMELVESARSELRRIQEANQSQARAARVSAAEVGDEVTIEAGTIIDGRSQIGPVSDKAVQAFRSSIGDAKRVAASATSDLRSAAVLAEAEAHHSLGDFLWLRVSGYDEYARFLRLLSEIEPALPEQGRYEAELDSVLAARDGVNTEMREAFSTARGLYERVGGGSDVKAKLDGVSRRLAQLIGEEVPEAEVSDTTSFDPPAGDDPAAAEIARTIDEALDHVRAGELGNLRGYIHTDIPEMRSVLDAGFDLLETGVTFNDRCKAKFDRSFMEYVEQMSAMGGGAGSPLGMLGGAIPDMSTLEDVSAADLAITVNGDDAEVTLPGVPGGADDPMPMRKIDGRWLLVIDEDEEGLDQFMDMSDQVVDLLGRVDTILGDVSDRVESGQIGQIELVMAALMNDLAPVINEVMTMTGGMGGPGGG